MSCNYANISDFGPSAGMNAQSNPLSYCALSGLDSSFMHTLGDANSILGPSSGQCQLFMAQYCATNPNGWDGVCEYLSKNENRSFPNMVQKSGGPDGSCLGPGLGNQLTSGQMLIRNTAQEKYLKYMSGNCYREYEPFDPTSAASPLISRWVNPQHAASKCIPIYDIDPDTVDSDPLMNKIVQQPWIAMDILVNIYNNRARQGTLHEIQDTKLGNLFATTNFQAIVGSKMYK